ncbi:hypothetical protein KAR91_32700 [Candidatus Pacearchaeota archaeon]|nr:hypothetical protein [Candidatus Pacearchaeota archaeon]
MAEQLKKNQLAQKVRESMGGNVGDVGKLLDALIRECHEDLETRRGDDFTAVQGEIKGYRKLHKLLVKQK